MDYFNDLNSRAPLNERETSTSNESYITNILKSNIGKLGTFYFTYNDSLEHRDKTYKGVIKQVGENYFIVNDPKISKHYLLQLEYLTWAEFDEPINDK